MMPKFKLQLFYQLIYSTLLILMNTVAYAQDDFRVYPYLQNPAPDAITVIWFSTEESSGILSYKMQGSENEISMNSNPLLTETLDYSLWEDTTFFEDGAPSIPFRHRIRIEDLEPATTYEYKIIQGVSTFNSVFRTAPEGNTPIRFIVYADSETEPESTGKFVDWPYPASDSERVYLIDQTKGYHNNLNVIQSRKPDLIIVAGDLVESGGEQRDWDEFWLHNTHQESKMSVAGKIPILPALGNHEYFAGPFQGKYEQPGSERAVNKYLTYFEVPKNHSAVIEEEGRYYAFNYGPASFITLDACNNDTNLSVFDTNFHLLGEKDSAGGYAPGFTINSKQYNWLEARLIEAQTNRLFTFIVLHHAPYSVGPHGQPPGLEDGQDTQSGVPVRTLTSLFLRYGVDAVFSGHDEMYERSEVSGIEIKSNGIVEEHTIHFYDIGMGGDGLRGPMDSLVNPYQKFLAHTHAPEVWEDTILIGGGKHYGHLEVDISELDSNLWQAMLKPVYVLPILDSISGMYDDYERHTYDDEVILIRNFNELAVPIEITSLWN